MSRSLPIEYEGVTYPSIHHWSREFAPVLGRSPQSLERTFRRLNGRTSEVVEYFRTPRRRGYWTPVEYEGVTYPSISHWARQFAPTFGRSPQFLEKALRRLNGRTSEVVDFLRSSLEQAEVVVNGRRYRNQTAFYRYLHRYYRVTIRKEAAETWEHFLERAIALSKKKGVNSDKFRPSGPVLIFGWRFRSLTAACGYYGHAQRDGRMRAWQEHIEAGKSDFEFFLPAIARLWGAGVLDERNRLSAEAEARMPKAWLPMNAEMEDVTDDYERKFIDAMQPEDAATMRRMTLQKIAALRREAGPQKL